MLDTREFERGRQGELAIARWLQERGWYVIPSYDYSGQDGTKAPRLQGLLAGYAIPDLDVCRGGDRMWVEVKVKGGATYHRLTDTFEHGISLRLYRHYLEVQRLTGTQVWLFVLEDDAAELRAQSIDKLGKPRIYDGRKMGRDGMAFWPRSKFVAVAQLSRCTP